MCKYEDQVYIVEWIFLVDKDFIVSNGNVCKWFGFVLFSCIVFYFFILIDRNRFKEM